jgi:hypothetical protein
MKRIVIIEGSVRGIAAESPSQDVLTIDINDVDTDTIAVPSAIGEVIAREAYRGRIRIVVEIGTEESVTPEASSGPLRRGEPTAYLTREELILAFDAARHAADEYRHENEGLTEDLAVARLAAEDFDNCAKGLATQLRDARNAVAFDPERHITKATVAEWLEGDASSSDQASSAQRKLKNPTAAQLLSASADDTRTIIARINATKESP